MSRSPAVVVPALALLVFALLVGCSGGGQERELPASAPAFSVPTPVESRAGRVLREWDGRRAAAYAAGSVGRLRRLYVPGVGAGDVRLLKSYVGRGLVVEGMRTQVLTLQVLRQSPRQLRVRVTDRLVGAAARWPGGSLPLPRDRPSTRELTLRRQEGRWLMAGVSPGWR